MAVPAGTFPVTTRKYTKEAQMKKRREVARRARENLKRALDQIEELMYMEGDEDAADYDLLARAASFLEELVTLIR